MLIFMTGSANFLLKLALTGVYFKKESSDKFFFNEKFNGKKTTNCLHKKI